MSVCRLKVNLGPYNCKNQSKPNSRSLCLHLNKYNPHTTHMILDSKTVLVRFGTRTSNYKSPKCSNFYNYHSCLLQNKAHSLVCYILYLYNLLLNKWKIKQKWIFMYVLFIYQDKCICNRYSKWNKFHHLSKDSKNMG